MAAQTAIEGIYQNMFTGCFSKIIFTPFAFFARFNAFTCPPKDSDQRKIVENIIKTGKVRDSLTENVFVSDDPRDNLGRLENALKIYEANISSIGKIKAAVRKGILPKKTTSLLVKKASAAKIITTKEAEKLTQCFKLVVDAMEVDHESI